MRYNGSNLHEVVKRHQEFLWSWHPEECANFSGANLQGVDLRGLNLRKAIFIRADLSNANLKGTNLCQAILSKANLYKADLRNAVLIQASLQDANLSEANVEEAYFDYAELDGTNLYNTNLNAAFLANTSLCKAKNIPDIPMKCPAQGAFIGWKKCLLMPSSLPCVVKLLIPENAKRSSGTNEICRADRAKVLEIQLLNGTVIAYENSESSEVAYSIYDNNFVYTPGQYVYPEKPFCENRWQQCGSGIYFFMNRQDVVNYMWC